MSLSIKRITSVLLALVLAFAFMPVFSPRTNALAVTGEDQTEDQGLTAQALSNKTVTVTGTENYDMAKQVLELVNKERANRNRAALTLDQALTTASMQRAAEISIYYSDEWRPNNTSNLTASNKMAAENIMTNKSTAKEVMENWVTVEKELWLQTLMTGKFQGKALPSGWTSMTAAELKSKAREFYDATEHYLKIIDPSFKSIGIGCFKQNDVYYWEQAFSTSAASGSVASGTKSVKHSVDVNFNVCKAQHVFNAGPEIGPVYSAKTFLAPGENFTMVYCIRNSGYGNFYAALDASNVTWSSSNPSVCTVNANGVVTAKAIGRSTITAKLNNDWIISHEWVVKYPIGNASVSGITSATYTGSAIEQKNIVVTYAGKRLTKGTDYSIRYINNTNASSSASVVITGQGNYGGSKTVFFQIKPATITSVSVNQTQLTYDGAAKKPTYTVKAGNKVLGSNDYTVTYKESDLASVGTKNVEIRGKGNYTGLLTTSYKVVASSGSGSSVGSSGGSSSGGSSSGSASGSASGTTVMYRMYNPNSGEHFYTASAKERDSLVKSGWRYEGEGWTAPAKSDTPVYRLYSGTDHHYTTSAKERDSLVKSGWKYEGIGWYSDDDKGVPLYRQFNPNVQPTAAFNNSGSHNYTTSKKENDNLVKVGWKAEGIGWYGVKK